MMAFNKTYWFSFYPIQLSIGLFRNFSLLPTTTLTITIRDFIGH